MLYGIIKAIFLRDAVVFQRPHLLKEQLFMQQARLHRFITILTSEKATMFIYSILKNVYCILLITASLYNKGADLLCGG